YTLWEDKAELHSRDMVAEDLGYIVAAPRSVLIEDTVSFSKLLVDYVSAPFERLGVDAWYRRALTQAQPASDAGLAGASSALSLEIARCLMISKYVAQDTVLRLAIAVFAMPAFVLACLLGAVDGLVRRDLRRWGGGRESSFVYHRAKRLASWCLTGGFAAYLSWPFGGFNPAYMVLVFTALVAASLSTTLATFKKYL
ncbi:MAG: TIGR03747 family integrating conjugative element membrane protein, partial [Burkholderiales bacterium]|nr:TIGR03747 family integrating conjugative element membrane protein [Burkholderiales bacterium]